ncbi:Aste57867_16926 [Aphanomyces stellatus]|uniref:Aste57867_16926 protein n=1 Tax=Aphanomyces stellatus TaxID=120398 RepID=A0A485L6K1_9STRA|nr:hypothetical protein As57867_016868 [Aphanomyces stellatus]VFT93688.1 Aste57867_16926 [Aphanomyces stellatus]
MATRPMHHWLVFAMLLVSLVYAATTPSTPFPGTSPCQQCANNPTTCNVAYKGLPGKYCGPWLSGGVKQACCCPTGARCVIPIKADSCGCDSAPTVIAKPSKSTTPFWVWVLVSIGVVALAIAIWRCCCVTVVEEPVYVQAGGVTYVSQPAYGYGGGNVATGVAVGAAAGIVGGVLLGEAMTGGNRYEGGSGGGYGGGGGADFGGDF